MSDKNRISPANIIAIVALAGIGVMSFFGNLFITGNPGRAIIGAAVLAIGLALLLFTCIHAKTAEDNFDKWRVVEYICLAVYLCVAIVFREPFQQFFHVVTHKTALQEQAQMEIKSIQTMCDNYKKESEKQLTYAKQQLESYSKSGQYDPNNNNNSLDKYINDHNISNFDQWEINAKVIIAYKHDDVDRLKQKISAWNIMELSSLAVELESMANKTWEKLRTQIAYYKDKKDLIPIIKGGGSSEYIYDGLVDVDDYKLGGEPQGSEFIKMFHDSEKGFNIGWIVYILLNLLALANYILVRRSPIIQIRKDKRQDDGGMIVKVD